MSKRVDRITSRLNDAGGCGQAGDRRFASGGGGGIAFAIALLATPSLAHADEAGPLVFAVGLPLWTGVSMLGAALVAIVGIEALVLRQMAKAPLATCLIWSLVVNAATTVIGILPFFGPVGLFVAWGGSIWVMRRTADWSLALCILLGLVIAILLIAPFGLVMGVPSIPRLVLEFYGVVLFGGVLSWFFEALMLIGWAGRLKAWRWSFWMNAASYAGIFIFLLVGGFRSGRLANTYWVEDRILHGAGDDHETALIGLEEFYGWLNASRGATVAAIRPEPRWDSQAALRLDQWLRDGDRADALRLYRLMRENGQLTPEAEWDRASLSEIEKKLQESESPGVQAKPGQEATPTTF